MAAANSTECYLLSRDGVGGKGRDTHLRQGGLRARGQPRMFDWYRRKRERTIAAEAALTQAQTAFLDAQAKHVQMFTGFLSVVAELSAKRAAAVLGSRGGRKRAMNRANRPPSTQCPICRDPNYPNVTVEMIQEHRRHQSDSVPGASQEPQVTNGAGSAP
jgi:hypothetical protein